MAKETQHIYVYDISVMSDSRIYYLRDFEFDTTAATLKRIKDEIEDRIYDHHEYDMILDYKYKIR